MAEEYITMKLKRMLHLALGRGYWECRPIPLQDADLIYMIMKNKPESGYYIQFTSRDGEQLAEPVLWQYSFWVVDNEKTMQMRAFSERQRQARYVFEANVKLVAKAYSKYFLVEGDLATITAYQYVKKGMKAQMKEIGVTKLYTDVKEL